MFLQLSKDGVPIIAHDDDLFRVTHTHAIVSQNTFSELSQLQYDNGEHIKSLSQLFDYYKNKHNTKFILETKIDHNLNPSYELEDKIAETVKQYKTDKKLKPRTLYKILNFNGPPQNVWLYTTKGWIKAKDILFYGFFDSSSLNTFENLSRISHYTNFALLPSTGQYSIHEANLFEKLKRVNNIIN